MLTRVPNTPFGPTTYIRSGLEERAKRTPVCGRAALACETEDPDIHHCCSAAKIMNPTLDAPLSWRHFSDTLRHYGIRMKTAQAREAYLDYLEDACMEERSDEIEASGDEMERFADALDAAQVAGDAERARDLGKSVDEKIAETDTIVREALNKAKRLAAIL